MGHGVYVISELLYQSFFSVYITAIPIPQHEPPAEWAGEPTSVEHLQGGGIER